VSSPLALTADNEPIVTFAPNNTYKALRIISPSTGYNLYYATHCNNAHELYNLTADPFQLENIYPPPSTNFPGLHPSARLVHRLDALLLILKSCKGQRCIIPWLAFYPVVDVRSLEKAMHPRFDGFYASVHAETKVGFRECKPGYLREVEGPEYGLLDLRSWVRESDGEAGEL
jgi:N-acetylglucosamine-6-sulfatase